MGKGGVCTDLEPHNQYTLLTRSGDKEGRYGWRMACLLLKEEALSEKNQETLEKINLKTRKMSSITDACGQAHPEKVFCEKQ